MAALVALGVTVAGGLTGCSQAPSGETTTSALLTASSPTPTTSATPSTPQPLLGAGAPTAASSTTAVAVRPARATAGQAVDVRVKVKVYGATGTGSVVVLDGGSQLRTLVVTWTGDAGTAEVTVTLPAGTHRILARYDGDPHHEASTSAVVTVAVAQVVGQVSVTASPVPKTRYKVRVAVTVRTHSAKLFAAGWVTVVVGGLRYTLQLNATGSAHVNIAVTHGARYTVTATYGGDTDVTAASGSASFVG